MIGTFKSKALRRLWESNDQRGVSRNHLRRVRTILQQLDAAERLADMNVPGFRLHALKGYNPIRYSVRVSGNWRITFEWRNGVAEGIDYEDYH